MSDSYVIHGPEPIVPLSEESLGPQLYDSLLKYKHLSVALSDTMTGDDVSYKTILEKSCLLAKSMLKHGVTQKDVIGIFSENNLQYFYPVVAAMYLGITVTTFNPNYKVGELLHVANISKPTIMFCSETTLSTVLEVQQQIEYVKGIIIINTKETNKNFQSLEEFTANNLSDELDVKHFKPIKVDTNKQVAFILYSSGTTGLPKGVMLTHKNINATIALSKDSRFMKQSQPGDQTVLGLLPFYHTFGLSVVFRSLLFGRRVIVLTKFQPEVFLKTVQDYKITVLHLVPPLANFLAKSPLVDKYDLSHVEVINCAAAPLSKSIEEMLTKRIKAKSFRQSYGMTEATLGVLGFPLGESKPGSCGKVLPYVSAKVVDPETLRELGPGQQGELRFKGDFIMKGYAGNPEATKQVIDEHGWLSTGDVGYYDDEGFFYIVDRIKELIKYKGFQVAPAELELILMSHPKIEDAGVVGLPDEEAGELPVAFVVKKSSKLLTEQEVKDFLAKQVSSHKQLRGGVKFVEEIPKNPSGKILRRELRKIILKPKL